MKRGQDFPVLFPFNLSSNILPLLMVLIFDTSGYYLYSQEEDSMKISRSIGGVITATNNGISLIPTFTLGKPAVMFDLSVGNRLTFEPYFRFAMEGKPWSFIFW